MKFLGKSYKKQSYYPSNGANNWDYVKPIRNRQKTGDFVTDNYTRRQVRIIRGNIEGIYHGLSKRDFDFLLKRIEQLGDEDTSSAIYELYGDLLFELYQEEYIPPKVTKPELEKLLIELSGIKPL